MHVLVGAYGRKYLNSHQVVQDFINGKDFTSDVSMQFRLCSCRDFHPQEKVELRYGQQNEYAVVTNPKGEVK